jgi:hypothetical protein
MWAASSQHVCDRRRVDLSAHPPGRRAGADRQIWRRLGSNVVGTVGILCQSDWDARPLVPWGCGADVTRNAASDNDNRTCGAVTLTLLIEPLPLPDAVGGCSDAVVVFES